MRFRPCIDIHNGQVKQIVGGTLRDAGDAAAENFVSARGSAFYSDFYYERGLSGGHVILLNAPDSPFYEKTKQEAYAALAAHPGFLQVGGGITAENAGDFLDAGASHVIVTSYVFSDGQVSWERLEKLKSAVGREHIVLDLSCRRRGDAYYIVTDRWQKFTEVRLTLDILSEMCEYTEEFLVHAVDAEGKAQGVEETVLGVLGRFERAPVTYAGGIASLTDIDRIWTAGAGKVDFTIGSALDLFGGSLPLAGVLSYIRQKESKGR